MQNPDDTLEKALELDPVIDLDYEQPAEEVVRKGPVEKSLYVLGSDSFGDKNIGFQGITPPSLTTITDRNLRIQYNLYVHVAFNNDNTSVAPNYPYINSIAGNTAARAWPVLAVGVLPPYAIDQLCSDPAGTMNAAHDPTGGGGVNGLNNTVCLRAFPLQSCMSTCDLRINGNSNSINMMDLVCTQPYLMDDEEVEYYASEFPCQRDSQNLYKGNTQYDLRNPMSPNGLNTSTMSRGSYVATLIHESITAGVIYRVYRYSITESLIISPLVWGKCFNADGFANIQNLTLNFNIQDINRAICVAPTALTNVDTRILVSTQGKPWDTFAGEAQNKCNILMNYYTQDPILSAKMGTNLFYDFDYVQSDANSNAVGGTINNTSSNTPKQWTGNALRINTIPDKIYVYIKPSKANFNGTGESSTFPDTFLRITQLNVGFNNQPSKLNTYTEADLYRMSVKNGLRMSWFEWRYTIGSIIIIDVVSDLGLGSEETAGQNKANMLKIDGWYSASTLDYTANNVGFTCEVMTVCITQGKAIISPNKAEFLVGGVTTSEVLALTTSKDNVVAAGLRRHLAHAHGRGGNMFSKVGKLLKHGLHLAKSVKPHHLEALEQGINHLGLGGATVAGKLKKHKHPRAI